MCVYIYIYLNMPAIEDLFKTPYPSFGTWFRTDFSVHGRRWQQLLIFAPVPRADHSNPASKGAGVRFNGHEDQIL